MDRLFDAVAADVAAQCPGFAVVRKPDRLEILGGHAIRDLSGREITRFAVRIVVSAGFPAELPVVFETAYRIPRTADRHVNPDGSCCVGVPANLRQVLGKSFRLSRFILGPMNDYFVGQAIVETGGAWPVGEARHGLPGMLDFWTKTLFARSAEQVVQILEYAGDGKVPRKNRKCPCGSGKRARSCHRRRIAELYSTYSPRFLAQEAVLLAPLLTRQQRPLQRLPYARL